MDRNIQRIGLINLLALLFIGGAAGALFIYSNSLTGLAGLAFLVMGTLVAMVSYFQMRLENRERIEQMEFDEVRKSPASSALFSQDSETFPARRSREQFERFFVPGFTILLLLLQGAAAYFLWNWLTKSVPAANVERASIAMALSALFSLIFFLLGKYAAGVARLENQRLLRPGASYLLLGSVICFLTAGAEAAAWFNYPRADLIIARILVVVVGLVAIENFITLIFEIYRPRLKGKETRLLYESRLIGLLGQPGGLITTAAQALDYQFGFKVSETWFYRFLEQALAWIILLQLTILFASTTVVMIGPSEQGVLERFGRPVEGRALLEPGLHFKLPWPFDKVYRFPTREIHTFYIGFVPDERLDQEKTVLWTRPHSKEEFNLLVASREASLPSSTTDSGRDQAVPVNLLAVNIPVQYRIRDYVAWTYQHADASQLLEELANREVIRYLVSMDMDELMTTARFRAANELRQRIQQRADKEYHLGVEILYVGLQGIHPPVKVADAFEAVVAALQQKETNILAAQAYWAGKIPGAYAEATNRLTRALIEAENKVTVAAAQSSQFTNQLIAFQASPSVYLQRSYLETFTRAVGPARKLVIGATNTQDTIWLNLEDRVRDFTDLSVPPPNQ